MTRVFYDDVRISGGADAIRDAIEAGGDDGFTLHVAPTPAGAGLGSFEGLRAPGFRFTQASRGGSALATHVSCEVAR